MSVAWKRARKMKNGEYDPDVDSVVKKIVSNSKVFFLSRFCWKKIDIHQYDYYAIRMHWKRKLKKENLKLMQEMIFLHVQLEGLPLLDICRVLGNLYRLRCTLTPQTIHFRCDKSD